MGETRPISQERCLKDRLQLPGFGTCMRMRTTLILIQVILEEISRKVFSAHFGQLGIIIIWLSGMYFHGAKFSNYEAWLSDPIHIKPSAQVVWPIVGQEILNGDVGGGFQGIQISSGFFQLWRASGITSELQLYSTAIGGVDPCQCNVPCWLVPLPQGSS